MRGDIDNHSVLRDRVVTTGVLNLFHPEGALGHGHKCQGVIVDMSTLANGRIFLVGDDIVHIAFPFRQVFHRHLFAGTDSSVFQDRHFRRRNHIQQDTIESHL